MRKNIIIILFALGPIIANAQLYSIVKGVVDDYLPDNISQLISPDDHRFVDKAIIDAVGASQVFAFPETSYDPGNPQNPVAYLVHPGTYTNFDGLTVTAPLAVLKWDGSEWSKVESSFWKPEWIGDAPEGWDSTALLLTLNPSTGVGEWTDVAGGNGSDSVFAMPPDTICIVYLGDTLCVSNDSILFSVNNDTLCIIQMGDTTCVPFGNGGMVKINDLGAADGTNIINNSTYTQQWRWDGLTTGPGLTLSSQSTAAGSSQKLLSVQTSGVNSTSGRTTYGGHFSNLHSGTGSTNIGLYGEAIGAVTNYGVLGVTSTGSGVRGASTSGIGLHGYTGNTAIPIRAEVQPTENNDVKVLLDLYRNVNNIDVADDGIGSAITFTTISTGGFVEANRITSKYLASTYPNLKSQMIMSGVYGTTSRDLVTISGDSITLDTVTLHVDVINNRVGIGRNDPARVLDVRGLVNINQSSSLNNILINGGSTSTSGNNNIAIGTLAGNTLTSGVGNSLLGFNAGNGINTGDSSVVIGTGAFFTNTGDHDKNVIIGAGAMNGGGGGDGNVMIGYNVWKGLSGNNLLAIDNSNTSQPLIKGDFANDSVRINGTLRLQGRFSEKQGADVASTTGMTLGSDGSVFEITGSSSIELISNSGWQNGSMITLMFTSTATLVDGVTNSGAGIGMELAGDTDFSATADDIIVLRLGEIGGVQRWREQSRSIN